MERRPTIIIVAELPARNGLFSVRLEDGTVLCSPTRQPFLDGARELMKQGIDTNTKIVMRHQGSSVDALSATVGKAAQLAVEERSAGGGPRFVKWRSFSRPDGDD